MSSYYCSRKFSELEVDIQARLLYNCCKAYPERVDLKWLEDNPGRLFNTDTMIDDRKMMLAGQRCGSCDFGCYKSEDHGLISHRIDNGDIKQVTPVSKIKTLNIALSTDCNLTCAYCSSEWSNSWARDIKKNGEYQIKDYANRYTSWQKLYTKTKQKDRSVNSKFFKQLIKEIELSTELEKVCILGGEPFLNNGLKDLIPVLGDKELIITSGLGLGLEKIKSFIPLLKDLKKFSLNISAEATDKLFEFIRYGCTWKQFNENLKLILDNGIPVKFVSTITNLSCLGILDFYENYSKFGTINYNAVTDRSFLAPNVLDKRSKEIIMSSEIDNSFFKKLKYSVMQEFNENEKNKLKIFLNEFSKRRSIDVSKVFPTHFLNWVGII